MRALLQRVNRASVSLENGESRSIQRGLVVLLGIAPSDSEKDVNWLVEKILNIRLFRKEGPEAKSSEFDLSIQDVQGELLIISQFTLFADARKGRRPDFTQSAPPEKARSLYHLFVEMLRQRFSRIATGEFGATMRVDIQNQGPVTILLDTADVLPAAHNAPS